MSESWRKDPLLGRFDNLQMRPKEKMRIFEGIMNDKVEKYNIPYRVIRSSRRTISVQIAPSGEVLVRCPRRMSYADIRMFVDSKSCCID